MSDPNATNAMKRPLLLAAAAVALLVGLFMAFKGWQDSRGAADTQNVAALRDRLHGELGSRLTDSQARFASLGEDRFLRADIATGEFDGAAQRLREGWPALIAANAYAGTLEDVYAEEPATVGYGKLAVLSAAVLETSPVLGVVGPGTGARLGMASALRDGDQIIAVIYGELPIDLLVVPLNESTADGGYIELRAGQTVLARQGDEALRPVAISRPLALGGLTLATATPVAETSEGLDPMVSFGAAVVALLLAGGLVVASRRTGPAAVADDGEVTMADVMKGRGAPAGPVAAATDKPVAPAKPEPERKPATTVDRSIFRAYDIRGVVGKTLDEGVARLIGQAVGSLMRDKGLREIVVGRDGRLSGPQLVAALIDGLRRAGCDVIDIGMAPTPLVYFATYQLNTGSGIAVTGSHNPPDYNGFKIMVGGDTLSGDTITDLYERIVENRLVSDGKGGLQQMSMAADYVSRVASDIQLERRMRVVIDAGNGVAGALAPELLEAIGADAEALYCEVDGTFPNHHPDPSDPANLADLITAVKRTGAELGLAFDGDGDRLGVVTRSGEVIYPDRLLMLFAQDVLSRNPGATVIYDVKCTGHLAGQILRHGGSPIMWKTGHSLIKSKMKETEAELAGEMSGHFFFRERWFGFDDGIYSAARLLEILAADEREPEEIFAELPKGVSTPELKIEMVEGEHYAFIERFRAQAKFDGAKIVTIDGIRADWPDGWGLVRCSNTTPSLVLRFDADNEAALSRIQALFREQLRAIDPTLKLPF